MLRLLKINNFAIMEDIAVEFSDGLTVITGETGAGKSMIVEAIATLCGEKMEDLSIRSNAGSAEVTGIFSVAPPIISHLKKAGVATGDEIIIRRRIERGKRQSAYINDHLVSLNLLKEIAQHTIDLIGQYENQSLLQTRNHLFLLDSYAAIENLKERYSKEYRSYREIEHELDQLQKILKEKDERMDYLRYQINEIEQIAPGQREDEELVLEKKLLGSSEKRSLLSANIADLLSEAEGSILETLSKIKKDFEELCQHDATLEGSSKDINDTIMMIEELHRDMSSYHNTIEFSQERLDEVLFRLDALHKLKKKHGGSLADVLAKLENMREELSRIESRDKDLESLSAKKLKTETNLKEMAAQLSDLRKKAARSLQKEMLENMSFLGMKKAAFEARFVPRDLYEEGFDDVEFFISTNPGEEVKPLRKIASGGEISRITLSLKSIVSKIDRIPTIVFDEVDTGISGRTAEAVGELLAELSKQHQIICITHLPQISIFARTHLLVEKKIRGKQTYAQIINLDEETRKQEIARMLGGKEITKKTLEHAAEFLQRGQHR